MPPRYAYWTILVDSRPTAFRAREREELLPTLNQLRRKNSDVTMKWFARDRLWESPEAERAARRQPKPFEKRGRDWRPGGQHKDPRARFDRKREAGRRERRPWSGEPGGGAPGARPRGDHPRDRQRKSFTPRGQAPRPKWRRENKAPEGLEAQPKKRRDEKPE